VERRRYDYQYGNAVRKVNTVPKMVPEFSTYEKERELKRRKAQEKSIKKDIRFYQLYTSILALCAVAVFFVCYQYLKLQSTMKTNAETVIELQDQLAAMKAENNSYEAEINSSVNYEEIYNTAVEELGMIYPSKSQVINYESQVSEYVKQYKDIAK